MGPRTDDGQLFEAALTALAGPRPRANTPVEPAVRSLALWQGLVLIVGFVVVVAGLAIEIMGPYHRVEPGLTVDTRQLVRADHYPVGDGGSHLLMTSVARHQLSTLEVLVAWVTRDERVSRTPMSAAAAGGTHAGMESSVTNAVAAARAYVGCASPSAHVGLETPPLRGRSGGLMLALAIVDAQGQDVGRGRVLAGTGTMSSDGTVGPVGDVAFKVRAAERDGAEIFLVPANQLEEARRAARTVRVVGVPTLAHAVAVLGAEAEPKLPTCG